MCIADDYHCKVFLKKAPQIVGYFSLIAHYIYICLLVIDNGRFQNVIKYINKRMFKNTNLW